MWYRKKNQATGAGKIVHIKKSILNFKKQKYTCFIEYTPIYVHVNDFIYMKLKNRQTYIVTEILPMGSMEMTHWRSAVWEISGMMENVYIVISVAQAYVRISKAS